MRWRRALVSGGLVVLAALGGGLWYADAVFLPTRGKDWLAQQLADRLNAHVHLETLSFHLLEGFVISGLRVNDLAANRPIVSVTYARGIGLPWMLLTERALHFRVYLQVEEPGPLILLASGRYRLDNGDLDMEISTKPVALDELGPATRRRLPPEVRAGTAVLRLHVAQSAAQSLRLDGTCDISRLVVERAPYRAQGDLQLAGTAQRSQGRWRWQGAAQPRALTVQGLRGLSPITDVTGGVQVADYDLTSLNLTGRAGDASIGLTGDVADVRHPRLQMTAVVQGPVRALRGLLPAWPADVQLDGQAHVTAELRGGLSPPDALQWTAQGQVTTGTLTTTRLPFPLERIAAQVRCDSATRQCTIERCSAAAGEAAPATGPAGAAAAAPLAGTASGTVGLADPFPAALTFTLTAPLARLTPWMPPALQQLGWSGEAAARGTLRGPLLALAPEMVQTEVELRNGGLQLPPPWPPIQRLAGRLAYARDVLAIPGLQFTVEGVPYTLSGTVQHLQLEDEPALTLRLASAPLTANLDASLEERNVHVRLLEGRYRRSTFRVLGDLLNLPHPTANFYAESALDLADVPTLPWPPAWRAWWEAQPPAGNAVCSATFQGPLDAAWTTGQVGLKVAAPVCRIGRVQLQQLAAEARLNQGRLEMPAFSALYAGGQVQGRFSADLRRTPSPFTLQVTASQVDVAQALQPWRSVQETPATPLVSGLLNTSWTVMGQGLQWEALRGNGVLQAAGENLGTAPVFDRLLGGLGGIVAEHLRMGQLRYVTFKQVEGHVTLANGRAATQDLTLRGDTMGVTAAGTLGFDGRLDLTAYPSVTQAVLQQSPLAGAAPAKAPAVDLLTLGRVRITGTLQAPQFTSQLAPAGDLFGQLLPGKVRDVLRGIQDILQR